MHSLILTVTTPTTSPAYLSQGCGSGSRPLLLCCSERELCQIWTSWISPGPSLCQSRLETAWTGLCSHTQEADRGKWSITTQPDWRHHTSCTSVFTICFETSINSHSFSLNTVNFYHIEEVGVLPPRHHSKCICFNEHI